MIFSWDEHKVIEETLTRAIDSIDVSPSTKKVLEHIFNSGGKRTRPLILLLCYRIFRDDIEKAINASLVIELLHTSSLLHDDIIDNGVTRRGKETVLKKYGISHSLILGDILISKAVDLASEYSKSIIKKCARDSITMADGELKEFNLFESGFSEELYLECIKKKTSMLFSMASTIGAEVAGAGEDDIDALECFGENLGIAYQMVDDLIDFMRLAKDKHSTNDALILPRLLLKRWTKEQVIDYVIKRIKERLELAKSYLDRFEDSDAKEKLLYLSDYMTIDLLEKLIIDTDESKYLALRLSCK